MIKVQESVPSIYYNSSRDFQLLGHLFDLVLNSVKTDADMVFNLPLSTNSDDQLLDLMAFTLGLRLDKVKYTTKQLRAVCSIAPKMMRTKGSIASVRLLCNALMYADGVEGDGFYLDVFNPDASSNGSEDSSVLSGIHLVIYISSYTKCRDALQELLPYILPAGMTFEIRPVSLTT